MNQQVLGGGAKLVLGVCGDKTIKHFHWRRSGVGIGGAVSNEFRRDLLETARLVRMNFIINNIISKDRDLIDIFAGDVENAFAIGVNKAREVYGVPSPRSYPFDLVIADAYPFDSSFTFTRKGWWPIHKCDENSHKLIISAIPDGIGNHPLFPAIPHRWQKIFDLYYEYQTSTKKEFFHQSILRPTIKNIRRSINPMIKSAIKNAFGNASSRYKHDKDKRSNNKLALHFPVTFVHSLSDTLSGDFFGFNFTNNLENYLKNLLEITERKNLRVAFYQTSSLTFPE